MKILSVLILSVLFSIGKAEYVDQLNIIGNEHTEMYIIERELHQPIPGEFDSILATQDRDRIYNLGLFSTVEVEQVDSIYTVLIVETFQFYPIPLADRPAPASTGRRVPRSRGPRRSARSLRSRSRDPELRARASVRNCSRRSYSNIASITP